MPLVHREQITQRYPLKAISTEEDKQSASDTAGENHGVIHAQMYMWETNTSFRT